MARKKIDPVTTEASPIDNDDTLETQSNEDAQSPTKVIEEQPETVKTVKTVEQSNGDIPHNTANSEDNLDDKASHEKQATPTEIPEHILKVLKTFSDLPKIYINDAGRVFTAGSKPSLVGNAILYKNPFYKSKK